MEFVLDTPLHLDSLWRPVLDVTRTVNHLVSIKINSAIMMMKLMLMLMMMREGKLTAKLLPSLLGPKEFLCLQRSADEYDDTEYDSGNSDDIKDDNL